MVRRLLLLILFVRPQGITGVGRTAPSLGFGFTEFVVDVALKSPSCGVFTPVAHLRVRVHACVRSYGVLCS